MELTGVYAPVVTPFDDDEEINYPALGRLIDFVLQNGASGLVPGGTTGEVYALSESERLDLFSYFKERSTGRAQLVAGINAGATRDVLRFARSAVEMGYHALMAAVPPYSRPNQRELLAHYRAIAEAVDIPIILYNFPWRAGTEVGYEVLDGLLSYPHVIGIKEASGDMTRVYEMRMRYNGRYQVICGSDDQALDYFLWGCKCWIGGAASCAPRQHVRVLEAALSGDFLQARTLMENLQPLLRNVESGSYTQKVKLGCELAGYPAGKPRQPLLPLPEDERSEFARVFALAQAIA